METPRSVTASGNRVYRRQRNTPIHLTAPTSDSPPSKALSSLKVAMKVVKFISRAQNSATSTWKPSPTARKSVVRTSFVTEERAEKNVDFNNPEDQKLVTSILIVRPQKRFEEEVTVLQKAFQDLEVFKGLKAQMDEISFRKMFRSLKLETYKAGEKIVNYGEEGKSYYIIIKGSTYVLLKTETKIQSRKEISKRIFIDLDENNTTEPPPPAEDTRENLDYILLKEIDENVKRNAVEKHNPGFLITRELSKGEAFGEVALNKDGDGKRTATILCKENTFVGVLDYQDYCNVLASIQQKKMLENIIFFEGLVLFKKWKEMELVQMIKCMEEVKFTRKQVLFREGDDPSKIYFIKKGEIELQKCIEKEKEESFDYPLYMEPVSPSKSSRNWIHRQKPMRLAILGSGSYFGECELLNSEKREHTAIVYSTDATLLSIDHDKFLNLVKDKPNFASLEKVFKGKNSWRRDYALKIADFRDTILEQQQANNTPENPISKPQKIKQKFAESEYFGTESVPSYFFKNLSPYKRSEADIITTSAIEESMVTRKHHSIPNITPSSSLSPKNNNFKSKFVFPAKNNKKAMQNKQTLQSKIFTNTFMNKLSDEHPAYSRQRRKLEQISFGNGKKDDLCPKKLILTKRESTFNETKTTKTFPESSRLYQLPSPLSNNNSPRFNTSDQLFMQSDNITPPISKFGEEHNNLKTEIREAKKKPMFKLMKALGLDRVYEQKSSYPQGFSTRSYQNSRGNITLESINKSKEGGLSKESLEDEKVLHTWQDFTDSGDLNFGLRSIKSPTNFKTTPKAITKKSYKFTEYYTQR